MTAGWGATRGRRARTLRNGRNRLGPKSLRESDGHARPGVFADVWVRPPALRGGPGDERHPFARWVKQLAERDSEA